LCDTPPQRRSVHVVREGAVPADLDHRQPFPVASLERVVAGDVDLPEPAVSELGNERRAGALAEVAPARRVERYG
jgi:hypothetical protein